MECGVVSGVVPGAAGALGRLAGDVAVSGERVVLAAWGVVLAAYSGRIDPNQPRWLREEAGLHEERRSGRLSEGSSQ